jgi:hypothetical protein
VNEKKPLTVSDREAQRQALRQTYLACLGVSLHEAAVSLRPIVEKLVQLGTSRKLMLHWGFEAGYARGYVRSILSRIFVPVRGRQRRPGPGRATPQEALVCLAFACERFGEEDGPRYLLAGYRAWKKRQAASLAQNQPAADAA